jgi:hypothetical protein
VSRSGAEQCRRRARECLQTARASHGSKRTFLLDMAQTWLRMAEEQETPPRAVGQQARPKKNPAIE